MDNQIHAVEQEEEGDFLELFLKDCHGSKKKKKVTWFGKLAAFCRIFSLVFEK